jgi:WD40 repeat protein/serine/threonine protein kinase
MPDSSADRNPLDRLAEEFVARFRGGERPSLTEYVERHPDLADEIREVFPALVEMEQLKPVTADQTWKNAPIPEPTDPSRVGEFRILRRVGYGGMGVVYEAIQESLGRHVALKLLPAEALADPKRLERFRREAKAAARLHHSNIVPVFGTGQADGRHYYAMQFIAGHPLDAVINEVRRLKQRSGSVPPERPVSEVAAALVTNTFVPSREHERPEDSSPNDSSQTPVTHAPGSPSSLSLSDGGRPYWAAVARIGAQVADALAYAHAQGIVHRDVKPSNLLLDLRGTVWVTDFGLAKANDADDLSHTGDVIGTLRFLPPERFDGRGDHRADIYALGLTLYEMLTLRPAFTADTRQKLIENVLAAAPPAPRRLRPAVPRDLETIVLKAIAREPADRYQSAADMADDLRRYIEDRPILARRASSAEQAWRWCRRNPTVAGLLACVLLVLTAGAAIASLFAVRATKSEAAAVLKAEEAAVARDAAQSASEEARRRVVKLYVTTGGRFQDTKDPTAALLWYYRAWEQDRADPTAEAAHRTRIAGILGELPDLLGVCIHRAPVCDAEFSTDGTRVVTRTDGNEAYLWDYRQSQLAAPPLSHAARVRHVCFSPDGAMVATASADGTACVWNASTGAKKFTLRHDGPLTWVAFHPNVDRIATAAEDQTVRMWSAADGKRLDWSLPTGAVIDHFAFSPDGLRLLTAGRDKTARVWSVDRPCQLSPDLPYYPSNDTQRYKFNYKRFPRFSPDGRSVVSSNDQDVILWSGGAIETIRTFRQPYHVIETYFVPNSDMLLLTGATDSARILDLADGRTAYTLAHPRHVNIGGVSPNGKWLITASSGGPVHVWAAATGEPVGTVVRCGDFCSTVQFSADGTRYLAASQDGTVRVWAAGARTPDVRPYQFDCGRANKWAFSRPDGSTRSWSPDGKRWIDLTKNGELLFAAAADGSSRPIGRGTSETRVRFCDDGSRFVVASEGTLEAYNAATGVPVGPRLKVGGPPSKLEYCHLSRDGARIVVWNDEKTLSVWDLLGGRQVFGPARHADPGPIIFQGPGRAGEVSAAALSPDGRRLAVGIQTSGTLTVWDVETGQILHHRRRFRGTFRTLVFTADGRRIVACMSDTLARVFDAETGEPAGPLVRAANSLLWRSDFSLRGHRLAGFDSADKAIRVWDTEHGERLLTLPIGGPSPPSALWFTQDGRSIIVYTPKWAFAVPLPRFDVRFEHADPLIRFLTGQYIDDADGIEFVDQFTFINDPDTYRRAFRAWKGLPSDE